MGICSRQSSVNRMLPEIGPSGDHASCSLCDHRHLGGAHPAPCVHPWCCGEKEYGSWGFEGTKLVFGCLGYKDPRHSPSWREVEHSHVQDQGRWGQSNASLHAAVI